MRFMPDARDIAPGSGAGDASEAGSWEQLEHPADLRLRLRGGTPKAIYAVAVEALAAVIRGEAPVPAADPLTEPVHLDGLDAGDLLVCLCNEALYCLEAQGKLVLGFTPSLVTPTELEGTFTLVPVDDPSDLLGVKAATYGALRWERGPDGRVLAEITLDL